MRSLKATVIIAMQLTALLAPVLGADAPAKFNVGEFNFARPADWQWMEINSVMRRAQLKVPSADKKDAGEVVFFFFGESGGGLTKDNIDRWLSQFSEPREKLNSKVEEKTVGGRKVTYVQAEGTYLSGMPGGPKTAQPGTMLLGTIIESNQGNVFIRFTGPVSLVKAQRPTFEKMVEGPLTEKK